MVVKRERPCPVGVPHKFARKGKWSAEEEVYTQRMIAYFVEGLLGLAEGTTLRSFLSERLNCDPMRITKKFQGESSIGKRSFTASFSAPDLHLRTQKANEDLRQLRARFLAKLQSLEGNKNSSPPCSGKKRGLPSTSRKRTIAAAGFTVACTNANEVSSWPAQDHQFHHFLQKLQQQTQPAAQRPAGIATPATTAVESKSFMHLASQPQPTTFDFDDDGFAANLLVNFVVACKKQRLDVPTDEPSTLAQASRLCVTF
jgi:hypothetical protein